MLTSRSGSQGHPASPPPQSIEAVRRRARHRLIGAAVMVLVGVLGFPLLFDTQPRPIAVDIPIEIPSRNTAPAVTQPVAVTGGGPSSSSVSAADSLGAREEVVDARPTAAPKAAPVTAVESAAVPGKATASDAARARQEPENKTAKAETVPAKPVDKADSQPAAKSEDKAGAQPATGNERIVVQVGAFAEVERAREARLKLERAGLKTYTHVAETPQGRRIRVRMGPFATRAEADKAATRAKALGLPAALLWL